MNFGDHLSMYELLKKKIKDYHPKEYFDQYDKIFTLENEELEGIYAFFNKDIFKAVYTTNYLMRVSDFMITKPSELVFYPIPKIFSKHIGGHEAYGAIHGSELGDASFECAEAKDLLEMVDTFINDKDILTTLINNINKLKKEGYYDGGYNCVKLAFKNK